MHGVKNGAPSTDWQKLAFLAIPNFYDLTSGMDFDSMLSSPRTHFRQRAWTEVVSW